MSSSSVDVPIVFCPGSGSTLLFSACKFIKGVISRRGMCIALRRAANVGIGNSVPSAIPTTSNVACTNVFVSVDLGESGMDSPIELVKVKMNN